MPIELQPVLLRVLEEKRVMRLGGSRYIPSDFRVIAASNKDLFRLVKENKFREDLYYRLSVLKISIPPLRERSEDILLLADYFIKNYSRKFGILTPLLTEEASGVIAQYSWPGNVRQLENAMIYAVSMSRQQKIEMTHLPEEIISPLDSDGTMMDDSQIFSMKDIERNAIIRAMNHANNNTHVAAEMLGIGRTTLYKKLKDYSINPR